MLKNYLKIAFRHIFRNKVHSFISIAGLAIGIGACFLIGLYVINEESYDTFNKNADRTVRATMIYSFNGVKNETAFTGSKLLPAFERDFPEVQSGVRFYDTRAIVKYEGKIFEEPRFAFGDSTFFKVFTFKLLRGNTNKALTQPFDVVLTEAAARKYFGDEDPIGKVLQINTSAFRMSGWADYTVTGVMENCPSNSQIKFDFLASFCTLPAAKPEYEEWWDADYFTYLLLKSPGSVKTLQPKIRGYMNTQAKENGFIGNDYMTFHLQPLLRVHLHPRVEGGFEPPGNYMYVELLSLIALLILIIGCANYVNLTTAKASERAREVGIRKTIGAFQRQLTYQFMGESLIVVLFALAFGSMLAELFLPSFNYMSAKQLQFSPSALPGLAAVAAIVVAVIVLLGGSYPALVLSRFQPIKVLKGSFKSSSTGLRFRKALITIQFVISVGLIITTLIIRGQMSYILNRNLGFNKDHVAVLPVDQTMIRKDGVLKNEFLRNQAVKGITFATSTPVLIKSTIDFMYRGKKLMVNQIGVDQNFLKTMDINLIAGRNFTGLDTSSYSSADTLLGIPMMLNETAVKKLGLTPQEAIGKIVSRWGWNYKVVGVVNNFQFSSMRVAVTPLMLFPATWYNEMMIRLSGADLKSALDYMKRKWEAVVPDHPFQVTFLNDDFNKVYTSETRTERVFSAFAILAVGLACLGLFGLVAFNLRQRTKEFGIRKTLGARPADIVVLLSKDYIRLVFVSIVIAAPIAWYGGHEWLEGFAYRSGISPWIFILTGFGIFALVMATICVQAVKAATANPVESLRYE